MMHAVPIHSVRSSRTLVSISPTFVREIAVVGPGIIGMPIAALLANADLWASDGTPARVTVVQRASKSSGWKVGAINAGRSPIGRREPALDELVAQGAGSGRLRATTEYRDIRNADVVLVCVQTDRHAMGPDYDSLRGALHGVAESLKHRSEPSLPLVVIESTLAPSTMLTMVRDLFAEHEMEDGRDIVLANSPSRAMPGTMVERVAAGDKLIGALSPRSAQQVACVYDRIVRTGTLHCTNSMTAEVVKTLENAFRDVRIAYAAEVVRYCDANDLDFFAVRRRVDARLAQERGSKEASGGGLLVPTVGVGGHGLPKDGVLLWWRALEAGVNPAHSLILEARRINDEAPAQVVALTERFTGSVRNREVALLGVAYRADSSDARNSPTLVLARHLLDRGATVRLHDPHVSAADAHLLAAGLGGHFHRDMADALATAEVVIVCVAHGEYLAGGARWLPHAQRLRTVIDACNAYRASELATIVVRYGGIGRGIRTPSGAHIDAVVAGLGAVAQGVANEAAMLVELLNAHYASTAFDRVDFAEVQRLAATCFTGCEILDPASVPPVKRLDGFRSRLVACALGASTPG
ncbi:MAG: UDP-glucose/GDP-mannose dehydrogenase with 6-phosphogluconate dehydrogenase at C-terminal end [Gemmatimonadetes bacterium]|nr:UDP-glucose/GDP-mannose dehydrogenase with 6-phosphogluconate dehydrogenase at C-terminal end [Gemmatimonadota bacterium]